MLLPKSVYMLKQLVANHTDLDQRKVMSDYWADFHSEVKFLALLDVVGEDYVVVGVFDRLCNAMSGSEELANDRRRCLAAASIIEVVPNTLMNQSFLLGAPKRQVMLVGLKDKAYDGAFMVWNSPYLAKDGK